MGPRIKKQLVGERYRINNSVGYTVANVVPCCKECNLGKKTMDVSVFLSWIRRVYEYQHQEDPK